MRSGFAVQISICKIYDSAIKPKHSGGERKFDYGTQSICMYFLRNNIQLLQTTHRLHILLHFAAEDTWSVWPANSHLLNLHSLGHFKTHYPNWWYITLQSFYATLVYTTLTNIFGCMFTSSLSWVINLTFVLLTLWLAWLSAVGSWAGLWLGSLAGVDCSLWWQRNNYYNYYNYKV